MMWHHKHIRTYCATYIGLLVLCSFVLHDHVAIAANVTELQEQITEKSSQLRNLESEIRQFQIELDKTSMEAQSLSNTVRTLDTTSKKIGTDIRVTTTRIDTTNLTIAELESEIERHENLIVQNKHAVAEAVRVINARSNESLLESMLRTKNISDAWSEIDQLLQFQNSLREKTENLLIQVDLLAEKKGETESQKDRLIRLSRELTGQKQAVETTKKEKDQILAETKNKEAEYQRLIQTKLEQKRVFEQALFAYEAQLKEAIDPTTIPLGRPGVLIWPLDNIRITQYFGKTVDSQRLYASGTHNGVDFGTPSGTPVKSVGDGIVIGVGNTDLARGCYSYGQWVLIRHTNGLSSLYAHLSGIGVKVGDHVKAGETFAFSGNTGYSTGPHLHLTIFASDGVEVGRYQSTTACNGVSIPLPTKKNAYLDPLPFMPPL